MVIDLISRSLAVNDESRSTCLTLRAFHRLRASFINVASVERRKFCPAARLKDLVRWDQWSGIRASSGIATLPKPGLFSPRTVRELTRWAVIHAAKDLKRAGEPWTRSEVRTVVRAVVTDHIGLDDFGDDDDFIKNIGIDR